MLCSLVLTDFVIRLVLNAGHDRFMKEFMQSL
jgi:hypothetical protein